MTLLGDLRGAEPATESETLENCAVEVTIVVLYQLATKILECLQLVSQKMTCGS